MRIESVPFGTADWSRVPISEHSGEAGKALWRTVEIGNIRVRISGLPHPDELVHHVESLAPANDTNQPGAVDVHA